MSGESEIVRETQIETGPGAEFPDDFATITVSAADLVAPRSIVDVPERRLIAEHEGAVLDARRDSEALPLGEEASQNTEPVNLNTFCFEYSSTEGAGESRPYRTANRPDEDHLAFDSPPL